MLASLVTGLVFKKWCQVVCYTGEPEIMDSLLNYVIF